MRIIAGEFRGRKLIPPVGTVTRPITDRVKQSVFDMLAGLIPGAVVYDCFCGTGSLGLECLSRGSGPVTFFDADRSALARLEKNLAALQVANRAKVIAGDLFRWFAAAPASSPRADLVFLDPPYRFLSERPADLGDLATILAKGHLSEQGLVIFRHDARDELALPGLVVCDRRDYGTMSVKFLKPANG